MSTKTYAALLRGINVGGKHIVPMKDLAEIFATAECKDVRTYIQSGNVVFTCTNNVAAGLCRSLEKKIEARYGFPAPVVLRSHEELAQVSRSNPFLKAGKAEQTLYVSFLANEPAAEAVAKLDPQRSPGDEFRVIGREIYLHFPNGAGRSKLTNAYFDSRLSTTSTSRNWATVLKLLEMTHG